MRTIRTLAAFGLLLILVGVVPVHAADGPDDDHDLVVVPTMTYDLATGVVEGTFEARGEDFCRRGSARQDSTVLASDEHGPVHVAGTDHYTCANGRSTLSVTFDARRVAVDGARLTFEMVSCISGGTGRAADLTGVAQGAAWADTQTSTVTGYHPFEDVDDDEDACPLG